MSTKLRALLAVLAAALLVSGSGLMIGTASASGPGEQVCSGLDSGKIDTTGDPSSVPVTAPDGKLIDGYCVKAGSSNQGDGPVYVTVDPPQKTVTIAHPSGKAVSHYSVSYTDDVPAQPDAKVTYTEWKDGDKSCESKTVTQTRSKTVTPYKWNGSEWVLDTANAVTTTETQTRPMTEAELKECSGSQPDSKVTYSDWVEGAPNCESKTVTKTRTKTVTPYKWNGSEWVLDTANATSTTETETRPLTEAELKECEGTPPPDDSCPPLTGSVKTTLADGSVVNGNIYTNKSDVYVSGSQLGDVTTVYIRVTDPSGSTVLSGVKQVSVVDGSFGPVQLPSFADTPNNGGEYKVWVSSTLEFEHKCTKTDNFKVKGEEPPPPTSVTPDKPGETTPDCQQPNKTVTPGSKPGVVWSPQGATVLKPGESVTYVATPAKDYNFPEGTQTSWTFTNTFDLKTCSTTTPTPTPTPTVTPTPTTPVTPTPTTPTETPTTPTETDSPTPTPEIGTPTSTSVPTPTSTPTFVPPSAGGGDWPSSGFGPSQDNSFIGLMSKLMVLLGGGLLLVALFAPRRRRATI